MKILTDGQTLFQSRSSTYQDPSRAELFGPLPIDLAPGAGAQWWGRFDAGSWIVLEVTTDKAADLEVELLDRNYRRVTSAVRRGPSWIAMAHLASPGIAYVRVRNASALPCEACLTITIEKAVRIAA